MTETMMWDVLFYVVLIGCLAALAMVGGLFLKGYLTGTSPTASIFKPKPEKRLDVIDQASIDGRRRLVLIRRDDVEHLIMTGGPVDVVIETGIGERRSPRVNGEVKAETASPPVFQRTPRLSTSTEPADA
jgi:hypothetical protein